LYMLMRNKCMLEAISETAMSAAVLNIATRVVSWKPLKSRA
jgi:hypothetical protein